MAESNSSDVTFDSKWPPPAGLTTRRVPRSSIIFPMSGRTLIHAPASLIWDVLRDTAKYSEWNSFCPAVTIHSQPTTSSKDKQEGEAYLQLDTSFTFSVVMNSAKPKSYTPTRLRVTDVSTPGAQSEYITPETIGMELEEGGFEKDLGRVYRIAWTTEGGFVRMGLRTERFSEIIIKQQSGQEEKEICEYRTWECQGGQLARTVKWMYDRTLQEKFALWSADLKRECERRVKEGI